ncbi:patatin family protein [Shewanella sp. Choline-02u-19]|uniref:patatin-like phospholipase family protein n=1 Tax=unclassified Shewanella TaxID=196818 RepID=UPI000C32AEA0|nr:MULTISPECIES: patatin family protein [unclassified Shewanella]PKG55920.1 patatin family protein [Shewanella sp. GutDb-MelDb]PKG76621.1 patatin family protein [Shewanella sp. GutCb]PKI28677.1 patatin family protein [Shewanella sp. Choline-02u-19]
MSLNPYLPIKLEDNCPHIDNKFNSVSFPIAHTALVAEGGGQRGIFTAGVLDSWLEKGFNPFKLLIGTSAGAQNLSSYITNQPGFAQTSIASLSRDPHFFNLGRPLIGRSTIDLDWYFNRVGVVNEKGNGLLTHKLNTECGFKRLKQRELLISTTNSSNYQAQFFSPNQDNWLTLLKASSALPFLYRKGVKLGDEFHVDGGLSAPLPVEEAYKRGAHKIVVIRTLPKEYSAHTPWIYRLKSWICSSNQCPKAIDYFVHHEHAYRESLKFIESPPPGVEVIQIFPDKGLKSRLLGSKESDIHLDYQQGKQAGNKFMDQHLQSLVEFQPLVPEINKRTEARVARYC